MIDHFWYSFLSAFFLLRIFCYNAKYISGKRTRKNMTNLESSPNTHACLSGFTRFASCFLSPLLLFAMAASLLKHRKNPMSLHPTTLSSLHTSLPSQVFYLLPFWLTKDYIGEALHVSNLR